MQVGTIMIASHLKSRQRCEQRQMMLSVAMSNAWVFMVLHELESM